MHFISTLSKLIVLSRLVYSVFFFFLLLSDGFLFFDVSFEISFGAALVLIAGFCLALALLAVAWHWK